MDFKPGYRIILAVFALCSLQTKAQNDIAYDHLMSASVYFNPSFAGAGGNTSFSHNFNDNNFNSQSDGFSSLLFTFDSYIPALHGGIGALGYYNQSAQGRGSSAYAGGMYALKIKLGDDLHLSPSVRVGYIYNKNSMIMPGDSAADGTFTSSKKGSDFSVGLLVNNRRFYGGVAIDHLFEPRLNCLDSMNEKIEAKEVVQFGYHYSIDRNKGSVSHLNVLFQHQKNNSYLYVNDYFVSKKFKYRMGGAEYFYRLLLGLGYKYHFSPKAEHVAYIGFGAQDHAVTLGGGFEFTKESYYPRTFEVSLKYVINND